MSPQLPPPPPPAVDRAPVSVQLRLAEAIADAPPPVVKLDAPPVPPAIDLAAVSRQIRESVLAELEGRKAAAAQEKAAQNAKVKAECVDGCECPRGECACERCPIKPAKKPEAETPKASSAGRFDGSLYYLKDAKGQEWYGRDWPALWAYVWSVDHPAVAASHQPALRYTVSNNAVYGSTCANGSCSAPSRTGIFRWRR
jgi:hypothetical protein